jgi:hypothetical protein
MIQPTVGLASGGSEDFTQIFRSNPLALTSLVL